MRAIGWQARASGWFTKPVTAGFLGVATVGVATKHARPGTAHITLYIGIRDEGTERVVAELCGLTDGYRQCTAVTSIGYLLPGRCWREWWITPGNAGHVAGELAAAVRGYVEPYLVTLSSDRAELLAGVHHSAGFGQAVGGCRAAVLLARHRGRDQADEFLRQRIAELGTRTDAAAEQERAMAAGVREWLTGPAGDPAARYHPGGSDESG
jgi:hypothetical protein